MISETWRLIEDGLIDGAVNMATDEAMMIACAKRIVPPTLRLYGWNVPTLSVGYSQDLDSQVDTKRCADAGVPMVRRPTGGRALLHHRELTYSLTVPIPHPRFPSSLRGTFRAVSEALIRSLDELGISGAGMAEVPKGTGRGRSYRSPACFAAANHCEIVVFNKKLVGSAQRRTSQAFLQHGSMWIDCDRRFVNSLFKFDGPEAQAEDLELLEKRTITLNEILGRDVSFEESARALQAGFRKSFPATWTSGCLTPFELELRETLMSLHFSETVE